MLARSATLGILLAISSQSPEPTGVVSSELTEEVGIRPSDSAPARDVVLERLARLAELYDGNALKFTAVEVTRVRNYFGEPGIPRKMHLVNLYTYYRNEDGLLLDRRIRKSAMKSLKQAQSIEEIHARIEAAGDPMSERQGVRGEFEVPAYLQRPYNWIRFFSRTNREGYEFAVEHADAPDSWRVRFQPKETGDPKSWYGHVDIDAEGFHVVRAEALQAPDYEEQQRMNRMFESARELPAYPDDRTFVVRHVSTEFSVIEHGLRFPSRVEVSIYRHRLAGSGESRRKQTSLASKIVQTYEDYRFFDVDVLVEYTDGLTR